MDTHGTALRPLNGGDIKEAAEDWRDDAAVKSSCCSYKGSRFSFYYPHSGSQLSVTSVLEDSTPSSDLKLQACMWYIDIYEGKHLYK